ncbi:MAG: ATP-binding protein [Pseudomonadota bacterium]
MQGLTTNRSDERALAELADYSYKLFWLRQMMFLGATVTTTAYLLTYLPIYCYLACLTAELGELRLARRVLSKNEALGDPTEKTLPLYNAVALWSSLTVCLYAVSVAWVGHNQFFFVPLTYILSAAFYAAFFNHQVLSVLSIRLSIYVVGIAILAGSAYFKNSTDQQTVLAGVLTGFSAAFFAAISAIVMRQNYQERRCHEELATKREELLRNEIEVRKHAQLAHQKSELRFRSLFDNAPIPIREEDLSGFKALVDSLNLPDEKALERYIDDNPEFLGRCAEKIVVVDANQASLSQHGYVDKTKMLKRVIEELSPAAEAIVRKTAITLFKGLPGRSYETTITRTDGSLRKVAATWKVLPGHEATYSRILLCSVDLTERHAAEEALHQSQKMEAVGQLTGGVAHDFNNLLTVIRGNVELLETDVDPSLSRPINDAIDRGAELTQRLLAFSRNQPLSARPVELSSLVYGMAHLLQRVLGEEISVEMNIEAGLWPCFADPGQVETAILNLAINARDAMQFGGRLRIVCFNEIVSENSGLEISSGTYVVVSVIDSGSGMDSETLRRATEPFFTTKEVGKGTGLGLSMIYGFAKQSGGALSIKSEIGLGTHVSLYLPKSRSAVTTSDPRPKCNGNSKKVGVGTVLLLEDNYEIRSYLSRMLKAEGYVLFEAGSAGEARKLVENGAEIDLLFSDIMLPGGVSGPDFAHELLAQNPSLPVVFMSGRPSEIEAASSGAFDSTIVLSKPFTKDSVLKCIDSALSSKSSSISAH